MYEQGKEDIWWSMGSKVAKDEKGGRRERLLLTALSTDVHELKVFPEVGDVHRLTLLESRCGIAQSRGIGLLGRAISQRRSNVAGHLLISIARELSET